MPPASGSGREVRGMLTMLVLVGVGLGLWLARTGFEPLPAPVEPAGPAPAGDAERLRAAAALTREAGQAWRAAGAQPELAAGFEAWHRDRRALHLWQQCAQPPRTEVAEVNRRRAAFEPVIRQHATRLRERWQAALDRLDFAAARRAGREWCALFPDDPTDRSCRAHPGDAEVWEARAAALQIEEARGFPVARAWRPEPVEFDDAVAVLTQALAAGCLEPLDRAELDWLIAILSRDARRSPGTIPSLVALQQLANACFRTAQDGMEADWDALAALALDAGQTARLMAVGRSVRLWAEAERSHRDLLLIRYPGVGGVTPLALLQGLARIPPASCYAPEARRRRESWRGLACMDTLFEADQRAAGGDYRSALELLTDLRALLDGGTAEERALLDPRLESCTQAVPWQGRLEQATQRLGAGEFATAAKLLDEIVGAAPAPVAAHARLVQAEVPRRQRLAAAADRYRLGDTQGALDLIATAQDDDATTLRERVAAVAELCAAGQAAADAGHANEALLLRQRALELEADDANALRRAILEDADFRRRCVEPARIECERGRRCLAAAAWTEAREHLQEAWRLVPNFAEARLIIADFVREAERDFAGDMARYHKGEIGRELVLARLEGVLGFLRPEDGQVYRAYAESRERLLRER